MKVGEDRLGILLYAEDVIVMSENETELQNMVNAVYEYSQDFCVKFREEKK